MKTKLTSAAMLAVLAFLCAFTCPHFQNLNSEKHELQQDFSALLPPGPISAQTVNLVLKEMAVILECSVGECYQQYRVNTITIDPTNDPCIYMAEIGNICYFINVCD